MCGKPKIPGIKGWGSLGSAIEGRGPILREEVGELGFEVQRSAFCVIVSTKHTYSFTGFFPPPPLCLGDSEEALLTCSSDLR